MPEIHVTRSYGCSFGCGNPYDYIVVSISDGTTEFLCLPCYIRLCSEMLEAIMNPDSPEVMAAVKDMQQVQQAQLNGQGPKARGKNAPATNDDPELLEAFDSVITVDDLPEEFR